MQKTAVTNPLPSNPYCDFWTRRILFCFISSAQCTDERTVGLIAQQVATVEPRAVKSGTSLKLVEPRNLPTSLVESGTVTPKDKPRVAGTARYKQPRLLEAVDNVQAIDMSVIVAQLVGAAQEQARQIEKQARQMEKQAHQIEELQATVAALQK